MTLEERLSKYLGQTPVVDPTAYIAPEAVVFGAVKLAAYTSIWPAAVLRGDINDIIIGEGSNVQDGAVIHLADDYGCIIGKYVTIGHSAVVHACTIEDNCLIGMNATILDGAVIGHGSIIGANALITQKTIIPPHSMVLGAPGKVVKTLPPEKEEGLKKWAQKYVTVGQTHKKMQPKRVFSA
jgi:gamma-carbonic anhydrase